MLSLQTAEEKLQKEDGKDDIKNEAEVEPPKGTFLIKEGTL